MFISFSGEYLLLPIAIKPIYMIDFILAKLAVIWNSNNSQTLKEVVMTNPAPIDIGITETHRQQIAEGLGHVLADTYTLYLKTHNFHWNVVGPRFRELHLMFEEQYNELALAVDAIAERIRTLGFAAPGTYRAYAELATIEETEGVPDADTMIRILTQDNETVVRTARKILTIAQDANDESTASLISDRLVVHEKTAWMIRSLLD